MTSTPTLIDAPVAKPHYVVLDGLRGTAALCVVVFHLFEVMYHDNYALNPLGHGFLAVDFFYCLSGFVIGYAYDNRLGKISVTTFIKNRLIRLHPLVIMGSLLGFFAYAFSLWRGTISGIDNIHLGVAFIASILLFPTTIPVPDRGGSVFPFNDPAWSLFLEYAANIFYILVLWRLRRQWVLLLAGGAAVLLGYVAFKSGTLLGGSDIKTFWDGTARILYSFLAGLLIYRYQLIIKNHMSYLLFSLVLILLFIMPYFSWNWLLETLVATCIFPFIIMLGAGTTITGGLKRICVFMGNISYPLYMTHYWLIRPFGAWYWKSHPSGLKLTVAITGCTIFLVVFAYLVLRFYDEPVRARLKRMNEESLFSKLLSRSDA